MQQALSVRVPRRGDRAERRRSARLELPTDLVIVRLRRQSTEVTDPDPEPTDVHWSHRWLVSGHWRNQWLPSRGAHRLQWIDPHVKGPATAPLVIKEHVTAWVR